MRHAVYALVALGAVVSSGAVQAQGLSPERLERMSKEKLDAGAYRNFAAPPAPPKTTQSVPLHQPKGMWVCLSTDPFVKILAEPRPDAPAIGQSVGRVAAGADRDGYTSVLLREGLIGWLPREEVRPYRNEFNPRVTCTVGGIRPNGVVTFSLQ